MSDQQSSTPADGSDSKHRKRQSISKAAPSSDDPKPSTSGGGKRRSGHFASKSVNVFNAPIGSAGSVGTDTSSSNTSNLDTSNQSRRKSSTSGHRKSQSVAANTRGTEGSAAGDTSALNNLQQMIDSMKSLPPKTSDDIPSGQQRSTSAGRGHRKSMSSGFSPTTAASAVPSLNSIADQDESLNQSFRQISLGSQGADASGVPPANMRYQQKPDEDGFDYEVPEDDYAYYGGYSQQRQAQQRMRPAQNWQFPPQQVALPTADPMSPSFQQGRPRLHIGHRRTPSELTPLMTEQLALQQQIELLQQQQQMLQQNPMMQMQMQQQMIPGQPNMAGGHRRHQSQQVSAFPTMPAPTGADGARIGHNRRHSANIAGNRNNSISGFQFPPPPQMPQDQGQRGHARRGSRNVDGNWRTQSIGGDTSAFVPQQQQYPQTMRNPAMNGGGKMGSFAMPPATGIPGMPAMAMMIPPNMAMNAQQMNVNSRKSLFAPYLPQASLPMLLQTGKLVMGTLRINKRNRSDAYVSTEILDADIYICGSKDRNRALEGDVVAVELLDVDEVWSSKREKEEKKRKKEEGPEGNGISGGNGHMGHQRSYSISSTAAGGKKNEKKKDDVEVEGQGLTLFDDEEVNDDQRPQFAGHIVAVMERMPGQMFAGTLGLLRPSSAATKERQDQERRDRGESEPQQNRKPDRPKIVWFKPQDKRVPLIAIPTEQAPNDFIDDPDKYVDHLFVACIKRWPITSLHPFGTLVSGIGKMGEIEVETEALLKDNNFGQEDFADNITKTLPPIPLSISEHETSYRRDLRGERVFTIDPASAKDLDDAIHIRRVNDGNFQVGVHIADVSFFVKPNTGVDREARKRATSVYLVQRAVPMLPQALCEELCSLNPAEDRLAFSVVWTLNEDARVLDTWFGKTIIRSRAKLSYVNAQAVIEGRSLSNENVKFTEDVTADNIQNDILAFHALAQKMRERRFENGSLSIKSQKLVFDLDDQGTPIDSKVFEAREANKLIEEFMLLANISVAQRIAQHFPEQALLRRHPEPIERRLLGFQEHARRLGYTVDISSGGALQESFNAIDDPDVRTFLQLLAVKPMKRAKYFCSGLLDIAKYHHYALNVPLYTHFTSPIRRYADVIVHRQLEAALMGDTTFSMDIESVAKTASHCNLKKDAARLAQEQSIHLFLCVLIHNTTISQGSVVRVGTVLRVLDSAFDVYIADLGIEKRVHMDQIPVENHVYDERALVLQIFWQKGVDTVEWLEENGEPILAHRNLVLGAGRSQPKVSEEKKETAAAATNAPAPADVSTFSAQDESALFDDDEEDDDDDIEVVGPALSSVSDALKAIEPGTIRAKPAQAIKFDNISSNNGHYIQSVKELSKVPVIVSVDMGKSPPVIKVTAVNPFA